MLFSYLHNLEKAKSVNVVWIVIDDIFVVSSKAVWKISDLIIYLFIIGLLVYVYASQKQIEWEVGGVRSDCCNHSRQQYPGHMITFTHSDASIQVTWSLSANKRLISRSR